MLDIKISVLKHALKLAFFTIVLAFCTSCDNKAQQTPLKDVMHKGYPKLIHSYLGSATLKHTPKRIITLGNASEDILVSLGVFPIAIEAHYWGGDAQGFLPWFKKKLIQENKKNPHILQNYPELDLETIIALKPDLILAVQSGLSAADFQTLSYFAPVIAYKDKPWQTPIEEQIKIIAYALDKSEEGEKLIKSFHQNLKSVQTQIPNINQYRFAYIKANPLTNSLALYTKEDPRVNMLLKMGMSLSKNTQKAKASFNNFTANISLENADLLNDADILFTWYMNQNDKIQTEKAGLFRSIRAVKHGIYLPIMNQSLNMALLYGSPLSVNWALPKFIGLLKSKITNPPIRN